MTNKVVHNVVYILGAGFSAPLGLPVVSNFWEKSQDLYREDSERYKSFRDIFQIREELNAVKNRFAADLSNVEEILSILEMNSRLNSDLNNPDPDMALKRFEEYIKQVIMGYTPPLPERSELFPSNWASNLFTGSNTNNVVLTRYAIFIGSLLNLQLVERLRSHTPVTSVRTLRRLPNPNPSISYSIITLNYDLVVENFKTYWENFSYNQGVGGDKPFWHVDQDIADSLDPLPVAKLHGSVNEDVIVLPTWNKHLRTEILTGWQTAYSLLEKADHIRIIGYSLPSNDAYMKYLLKAAVQRAEYLKRIDVLCLDSNGEIEKRYRDFIAFNKFRFVSNDVMAYLDINFQRSVSHEREETIQDHWTGFRLDKLEETHERLFFNS